MKILTFIAAILISFASFSALAADPIQDLTDVAVPVNIDGSAPTLEDVKLAIIAGCKARGWSPSIAGKDTIGATILVRSKYHAEIEIPYNATSYSILYKSSRELDYNEEKRKIHRNYNKWVAMLSSSIQREFGVRSQMY